MTETYVYRCPIHGIIESPTRDDDDTYYCPIVLVGGGVCCSPVVGPFPVRERT